MKKPINLNKIKIKKMPTKLIKAGWIGFNKQAGHCLKIKTKLKDNEFYVNKNLPKSIQKDTVKHEGIESYGIKKEREATGKKPSKALYIKHHKIANKLEKLPISKINKKLQEKAF